MLAQPNSIVKKSKCWGGFNGKYVRYFLSKYIFLHMKRNKTAQWMNWSHLCYLPMSSSCYWAKKHRHTPMLGSDILTKMWRKTASKYHCSVRITHNHVRCDLNSYNTTLSWHFEIVYFWQIIWIISWFLIPVCHIRPLRALRLAVTKFRKIPNRDNRVNTLQSFYGC